MQHWSTRHSIRLIATQSTRHSPVYAILYDYKQLCNRMHSAINFLIYFPFIFHFQLLFFLIIIIYILLFTAWSAEAVVVIIVIIIIIIIVVVIRYPQTQKLKVTCGVFSSLEPKTQTWSNHSQIIKHLAYMNHYWLFIHTFTLIFAIYWIISTFIGSFIPNSSSSKSMHALAPQKYTTKTKTREVDSKQKLTKWYGLTHQ